MIKQLFNSTVKKILASIGLIWLLLLSMYSVNCSFYMITNDGDIGIFVGITTILVTIAVDVVSISKFINFLTKKERTNEKVS
jgi:hypothetical protein